MGYLALHQTSTTSYTPKIQQTGWDILGIIVQLKLVASFPKLSGIFSVHSSPSILAKVNFLSKSKSKHIQWTPNHPADFVQFQDDY